ncbi:FAD-dependent monooxygenase [Terriglobus sp. TAA 43]|uniref:FAD-dependent monooxygenase n=1 Tax=Terriglobus sp. TAA 43 TaxID=278961 RepID=UPI000646A323|nr:FAD-dependent monooxygenase [Terriglobus sp. TAA 43]
MATRMEDVIIVGAGPTGLALAAELRRLGIAPMLFDRVAEGANTSRATVVHARTLEVLEPLAISDIMVARGIPLRAGHLREKGGAVKATIAFDELPTKYPFALALPQNLTEEILVAKLRELGGSIHRPIEVTSLTQSADSATVTYTAAGTLVQELRGRWVVGCDGLHSTVRQATDIAFTGGNYEESFVLADVEMDWPLSPHATANMLEMFLGDEGITLIAPLPNNIWRIIATQENAPQNPAVDDCQRILDTRTVSGAKVYRVVWSSRFRIQHRVASKLRQGRVLIAGDAAHVHSPAGGQGMNTGVQDAVSLASALATAIRTGDESELASWEEKRLKIAHSVVNTTDKMTKLVLSQNPLTHLLREAILGLAGHVPAMGQAMARRMSEIDNR